MLDEKEKFTYNETPDRMLKLADKVTTMGRVISALAYYDDERLILNERDGQNLGDIIRDCGIELKETIDTAFGALGEFYDNYDDSLGCSIRLKLKKIKNFHYCKFSLDEVNKSLDEIKRFEAEAVKVEELKKELLQTKQNIEEQITGKEPLL
jgi:hypothetical protein